MPDRFYERHQDYVLDVGGPAGNIGTLAANTKYPGIPLVLDPDADFIMRGMAARMTWDLSSGQNNLSQLYFKLKNKDTHYTSTDWIPFGTFARVYGQGGNPAPWWPHLNYPKKGVIEIDLWNNGANTLPGVQMVFRGVKRFPNPRPSLYPQKISRTLNWTRSVKISGVGVSGSTATVNRFALSPAITDADFVLRHIQAGAPYNPNAPSAFFTPRNVWLTLRDIDDYPYSNLPVDWNILAGQATMAAASGLTNSTQFGPWHPGLFYPEIYIRKNEMFTIDVVRDDSPYNGQSGLAAARIDLALGGSKVFSK